MDLLEEPGFQDVTALVLIGFVALFFFVLWAFPKIKEKFEITRRLHRYGKRRYRSQAVPKR